jgi:ATP-dependent RNA helicase SUPV3L1/SUV3
VIREATRGADRVRLLWDVAQIPDYRKESPTSHARLLARIFNALTGLGRIDDDWAARSLATLDRTEGDIDALTQRIEHVRTWRYIAHRTGWMKDSEHWQGRTRDVEDRLSDALHDRLTQRFVDRRASVLMKRLKDSRSLLSHVGEGGAVEVEGHYVGRLVGLKFTPDGSSIDDAVPHRAVRAASARALAREIPKRVREIVAADDTAFAFAGKRVTWNGAALGELAPGRTALKPEVTVFAADGLSEADRQTLRRRLEGWVAAHIARRLAPLVRCAAAAEDPALNGHGRAIVHRLVEGLGLVPRTAVAGHVDAASPALRKRLAALGIRIGRTALYLNGLKDPALRMALASLHHSDRVVNGAADGLKQWPPAMIAPRDIAPERLYAAGYLLLNTHAVRVDVAERLAAAAATLAHQGPFAATPALSRTSGLSQAMLAPVLKGLGYSVADRPGAEGEAFTRARKRPRRGSRVKPRADSPFAKLADLVRRP